MSTTRLPSRLTAKDRTAVQDFLVKLYRDHGQVVQQLILFGSKARGDSRLDSDIDILIIVEEESWPLRDAISTVAARISLEFDILIGPRVIGRERWHRMQRERFSFYEHIAQEGIPLSPELA